MATGITAVDGVVAVGVNLHVELLAGLHEGFGVLGGIAEVDVVVGHAVDEQQTPLQLRGAQQGRCLVVAAAVLLRRPHETLGIDAVVEPPVGGRGDSDAGTEGYGGLAHGHEGHVASVAPAPDGDTAAVNIGLTGEPAGGLGLVTGLKGADVLVGALLEVGATATRAATVNADADDALLGEQALPRHAGIETRTPFVLDLLRARTAVLVHDDGEASPGPS